MKPRWRFVGEFEEINVCRVCSTWSHGSHGFLQAQVLGQVDLVFHLNFLSSLHPFSHLQFIFLFQVELKKVQVFPIKSQIHMWFPSRRPAHSDQVQVRPLLFPAFPSILCLPGKVFNSGFDWSNFQHLLLGRIQMLVHILCHFLFLHICWIVFYIIFCFLSPLSLYFLLLPGTSNRMCPTMCQTNWIGHASQKRWSVLLIFLPPAWKTATPKHLSATTWLVFINEGTRPDFFRRRSDSSCLRWTLSKLRFERRNIYSN